MGSESNYIYLYGKEYTRGLQNVDTKLGKINGVLATAKHYIGDGSTMHGANQGDARIHGWASYVSQNSQGYKGAIASEVGSVMASYSAINGIPSSINSYYLLNVLRQDLGFGGLIVSDYDQFSNNKLIQMHWPILDYPQAL